MSAGVLLDMWGRTVDLDGNPTASPEYQVAKAQRTLADLYGEFGLTPEPAAVPEGKPFGARDLASDDAWKVGDAQVDRLSRARIGAAAVAATSTGPREHVERSAFSAAAKAVGAQNYRAHLLGDVHRRTLLSTPRGRDKLAAITKVQDEIGWPGTRVLRGLIQVEFNARLQPVTVRGSYGTPGLYEELYRVDPGIHKHLNETTSLVCSATYEPQVPEGADKWTKEIVERTHRAIRNHGRGRGYRKFLRHAASVNRYGFAPFELRWAVEEDGFVRPWDALYRDVSSVYEWVFDERQTRLLGCIFRAVSSGGAPTVYALPRGDTYETARLLVANIGDLGNNVEGCPPLRPTVGLRRLKELILQLYGLAWQLHGTPLAVLALELIDNAMAAAAKIGTKEHKAEIQTAITRIEGRRSRQNTVIPLPPGSRLEYVSPQSSLPDIQSILSYIDHQIALAFSNEGAMLGTQTGSYALASAKENSFLRSAPAYAESVAEAHDEWLAMSLAINHPDPDSIEEWPRYGWRFAGTQDSSRWTADVAVLRNSGIENANPLLRRAAEQVLGLEVGSFDPVEVEEPEPVEEPPVDDQADEEPPPELDEEPGEDDETPDDMP